MRHMTQYQLIHSRCVVTIVTNRQRRQSQRSWNNIRWLQPIVFYLVLYSSQHTQTLTLRFNERFQRIRIYSSIILYKLDSSHSMNTCRRNRTNPSEYPISEDSEYLLLTTIHIHSLSSLHQNSGNYSAILSSPSTIPNLTINSFPSHYSPLSVCC